MRHTNFSGFTLPKRLLKPLVVVGLIAASVVLTQALSFSMPPEGGDGPMRYLRRHAVILAIGAAGTMALGAVISDLLKRIAALESRLDRVESKEDNSN